MRIKSREEIRQDLRRHVRVVRRPQLEDERVRAQRETRRVQARRVLQCCAEGELFSEVAGLGCLS